MATQYIIDTNKVYPKGTLTTGIYVTNSSGTRRESFYAVRGTGSSSVLIYDKVLYTLTVNTPGTQEPSAGSGTFTYTSNRKHGNGTTDNLSLSPTTYSFTANTSRTSTKTTTVTVNQALTANGTAKGPSVTVTITQAKDYPVSITVTWGTVPKIPGTGGTVSSVPISSVVATYKSSSSTTRTLGSSEYTVSWNPSTGVSKTTANTGTTEITVGTLTGTVSFTENGHTVTASKSHTIVQATQSALSVVLNPSTTQYIAAGGGNVTFTAQAKQNGSNVSATYSWSWATESGVSGVTWDSTNHKVTKTSLGTTTKTAATKLGRVTVTATYNGLTATAYVDVYQNKNTYTDSWNNPTVTISPTSTTIPQAGGTSSTITASATQSGTRTWESGSTSSISNTSFTWKWTHTNTAFTLSSTTAASITVTKNSSNTGNSAITDTLTAEATGSASKKGTKQITVSQPGNSFVYPAFQAYLGNILLTFDYSVVTTYDQTYVMGSSIGGNGNYINFQFTSVSGSGTNDLYEVTGMYQITQHGGYVSTSPQWVPSDIQFTETPAFNATNLTSQHVYFNMACGSSDFNSIVQYMKYTVTLRDRSTNATYSGSCVITNGVPNQVQLDLGTVASGSQSPNRSFDLTLEIRLSKNQLN